MTVPEENENKEKKTRNRNFHIKIEVFLVETKLKMEQCFPVEHFLKLFFLYTNLWKISFIAESKSR